MHTTMHMTLLSVPLQLGLAWERVLRGVCAVSSDKRPRARRASRALHRACGQGADLSLRMVRLGLGRFVGWDSGWDCARGIFPPRAESVLTQL